MRKSTNSGFTLTELLVGISILCIIIPIGCGKIGPGRNLAREAEAKAGLHRIAVAVERYNTDHHEYPAYLLGGDFDGWVAWHRKNDEKNPDWEKPANKWVRDPLIDYGYMRTYPRNPFIDLMGGADALIKATSFVDDPRPGDGDPRFGFNGNIMGMGLDDPNFFEDASSELPYSRIEMKRTLDRGKYDPLKLGYPNRHQEEYPGLYYNWGGVYNYYNNEVVFTYWCGNFFYRAGVTIAPARSGYSYPFPNANCRGPVERYMLGVWGGPANSGKDVIRLQAFTPDAEREQVYWRFPPPWSGEDDHPCGYSGDHGEPMGLPAVFGAGDAKHGPWWPADRCPDYIGHFIYGAPDGVKDGIILVLTTGAERERIVH